MEMIRKGRTTETRSGRPPAREATLSFERIARNIRSTRLASSWSAGRGGMALRQVRGDDLIDLFFGVRLEPGVDAAIAAAPEHDHGQMTGLTRIRDDLLEVARRSMRERL